MKLCFRWYGDADPVTLEKIRQISYVSGIVSAVYDVKPGEVWSEESIHKIKEKANSNGLSFEVVESVPVSEEIKLGTENAKRLTENYCENLKRLGRAGVKCVCYNFMPVFDWLRSELGHQLPDGSNALAYDDKTVRNMDPLKSELSLPGWDESYKKEELKDLISAYKKLGSEGLFKNLETFLKEVIPAAEESGINMAIHPDDPPWDMFGLPRIITCRDNIKRMLDTVPISNNGLTFCTGSLGANPQNNLITMAEEFSSRIHFAHIRNIKITGERCFEETSHKTDSGSLDICGIVQTLVKNGFDGYVRPDHGRMIWGESGRFGYGLYDRALGAAYLSGLFEAEERKYKNE